MRPTIGDAHERPPQSIKDVYKFYQKVSLNGMGSDPDVLDLSDGIGLSHRHNVSELETWSSERIAVACRCLRDTDNMCQPARTQNATVFQVKNIPG